MLRVLIADDHAIVRKGLVEIIRESRETILVDEACNGVEALIKAEKCDYDLVLLDISMPDKSGLEVLKELKMAHPERPVLMLSIHPEEQYAVRSLRDGASGYITKGSATNEMLDAIRKVISGGKYISSSLAEKLAFGMIDGSVKPIHESLSNRENHVMRMISKGKTTREIAVEMSLSVKTISTFRSRILRKMRLKSNADLTHYAIQNNLLD